MRPLSASEAINPAIIRTKVILFHPFRKGRSWKLAAVAYLSAMGLAFVPYPFIIFAVPYPFNQENTHLHLVLGAVCLLLSAIMLLFFYLGSRLQFVLFDIAAQKSEMVGPLWRKYGSRTWPWLTSKLVLSLTVSAIFAAPIFYAFRSLITHMPVQPGKPPSPEVLANLFVFYALMFAPIAILMLCSSLLSDFVLPPIALEDATLDKAASRFLQLFRAEPIQICAYIAFKILFAIAGVVAAQVAIVVAETVVAIPFGLLALLGWFLFRSLGLSGHILLVAGSILLALIFCAAMIYVVTLVLGCAHMFYQAYAVYFLGGRYPLLGDLLEPPNLPTTETPSLFEPRS